MKAETIEKLARIAKAESEVFLSGDLTQRDFYARTGRFLIERRRMADMSIGIPTSSICIRTHSLYSPFPAHTHDFIELMYVCSGKVTHVIGNKTIELACGDIILLGKSTKHSILPTTEEDIGEAIALIARQNRMTVEDLKEHYSEELEAAVIRSVLTTKAMEFIRANAEITEE